jgi:cyclopropane-fatty-acyl-phospholipid synthase
MISTRLLKFAFSKLVRTGSLMVIAADGRRLCFGDGSAAQAVVRFTDARAQWAVLLDPDLRTGEMFTEGRLIVERGAIYDFLALISSGAEGAEPGWFGRMIEGLRSAVRGLREGGGARSAGRDVTHRHELGDELYALFLDPDWQYSCAYFEHPSQDLAQAQLAKKRHIAAKLLIGPGDRVLDIGCGWGGMACYLAQTAEAASVLGVTLSDEQIAGARRRAEARGLADKVAFDLRDYRAVTGQFERIVSVGMFEHVGLPNYATFFQTCRERLTDDGVMLLHTIGVTGAPSLTNPWITKYIFPGGHLPSLSEMAPHIERAGLIVTDMEVLRLHYADTLRAWRRAFMARRGKAVELFDERFARMWEYYLSMSEAAFRFEDVVVFQLQLARRNDAVPLTRDYMASEELRLRSREQLGDWVAQGAVLQS